MQSMLDKFLKEIQLPYRQAHTIPLEQLNWSHKHAHCYHEQILEKISYFLSVVLHDQLSVQCCI